MNIGSYWKIRDLKYSKGHISKNKDNSIIRDYHPLVVFYTDEYVYYLTAKSLIDRDTQLKRKVYSENVSFNEGLLNNNYGEIVNCTSINIMERKEFENLFELDNEINGSIIDNEKFKIIINKLYENILNKNMAYHKFEFIKRPDDTFKLISNNEVERELINNVVKNIKKMSCMSDKELNEFRNIPKDFQMKKDVSKDKKTSKFKP
ncbi:Mbov_0400 family ICE element protein [Mycoplasmopsis primatum]|uniref:Mbov_0400 family ICE element protein n=1 Tax=Mycoplasmopsis primatum TaxID=55604 RepID=UPI0012EC66EB|nr:hypothetical protein [Mycoplasmopsis primatum]